MPVKPLFIISILLISLNVQSQQILPLASGTKTSIRGLSVVTDKVVWVSGSNGTVGRSVDGGTSFKWMTVPGYEKRDFRDIEAFDEVTAIIMAVAEPAVILKTVDGGQHWKLVYENNTPGMFLDAMEFWNEQSGIVIGDPINSKFFIARTFDEGNTWREPPAAGLPVADSGEACFASSGTNIRALDKDEACFISGGLRSRLFWKGQPINLPIVQGSESTGANSVAVRDNKKRKHSNYLVVVGGNFAADTVSLNNCYYTTNGGQSWQAPATPPRGYKSCVEFITKNKLITCGTSGVDVSSNGGKNWQYISNTAYHVCRRAKDGSTVYLAGGNGKIAKLVW